LNKKKFFQALANPFLKKQNSTIKTISKNGFFFQNSIFPILEPKNSFGARIVAENQSFGKFGNFVVLQNDFR
jgi:hypothetical protein